MSEEIKYYPLTTSQMLMFFNLKYSFKKQVVNICTGLHFDGEIDENLMRQAVALAMLRNPAATLRLHKVKETGKDGKKKTSVKQYFSKAVPSPMEYCEFTSDEELEAAIREWGATPFPNGAMDTQLYRVIMVKKPDGHFMLYYCVNHIIYDAYSLMSTCKDLMEIYIALRDGKPLPPPLPSPLPAYQADWDYFTSEQHKKDRDFWENEAFPREPKFTSVCGSGTRDDVKGKNYGTTLRMWEIKADQVNYPIPKDVAGAVMDYAMQTRIPPQLIYMLAIRAFLSKENDNVENIMIFNAIARRATRAQKTAGGTMVQAIPFYMDIPNTTVFADACRMMQKLQNKYYRHVNLSFFEQSEILHKKYNLPNCMGYHTISLTFQPYAVEVDPTVPVHMARYPNGAATLPLYLTIMAMDNSGDLMCNYEYITKFITPERIKVFHDYVVRFVAEAVKHPEKSLQELM